MKTRRDEIRLTDDDFARAAKKGRERARTEPRAKKAWYDRATDRVIVDLKGGATLSVPRVFLQGVQRGTAADYADITVEGAGYGLHWERLDADISVPSLVLGLFGSSRWMAELGRAGGRMKSKAKAAAARRNGAKGGRPRTRRAKISAG